MFLKSPVFFAQCLDKGVGGLPVVVSVSIEA